MQFLGLFRRANWRALAATMLALSVSSCALQFPHHNRSDADWERHGRWRVYYDDATTQLATDGRYQHGRPVGKWRYYAPANQLERQERYLRQRGQMLIRLYHPTGRVAQRGRARIVSEGSTVHFYWYGRWREYSPAGRRIARAWYVQGQLQKRQPVPASGRRANP